MNIIIFSKESRDAHGEYGPHVWWYQEEVNPRRRERYLVSAHCQDWDSAQYKVSSILGPEAAGSQCLFP